MNQDSAIGILRSSAIVRAVSRLVETVERAARHSASRVVWSDLAGEWRRFDRARRLQSIGVALVSAVVVHLGLLLVQPLPGWRGFVVPAMVLAQGLLLIVSSSHSRTPH